MNSEKTAMKTSRVHQFLGLHISNEDEYLDDTTNVTEIEAYRENNIFYANPRSDMYEALLIAIAVRDYDHHLLEVNKDGWYLGGVKLGKNLKEALLEIITYW